MAQTKILDGVTASGRDATGFAVDDYTTVRAYGLSGNEKVRIEVQDAAGTGWEDWKPEGEVVDLTPKRKDVVILAKGTYTVNLQSTPASAVTVVTEV